MNASTKELVFGSAALLAVVDAQIDESRAQGKDVDPEAAFAWVTMAGSDPILSLIGQIAGDLDSIEDDIADLTRRLVDNLTRGLQTVERGEHANSLGVVQSGGLDVDRAYAKRALLIDSLKRTIYFWARATSAEVSS